MGALARRLGTKGLSYPFTDGPYPWDGFTPMRADRIVSSTGSALVGIGDRALSYAPFWSAVRVLSETLAQLPLVIYRTIGAGGKERAPDHPLYELLHTAPNPEMTSFVWRETGQSHAVTWGNSYSEKVFDSTGQLVELWPLAPDRMEKRRNAAGTIFFRYRKRNGDEVDMSVDRVFHVPGLGWDGNIGYSVIAMARAAVGLGLSAETFGANFFDNGSRMSGIISTNADISQEGADTLREKFEARHAGARNAHRTGVLTNGATFTPMSIPPEDAQFLQTRKFQVTEIARMFRVQPHMIADLEHATFTNIEQQSLDFVKYTMLPWLTRWEQQINKDLLANDPSYFAEFLVDGLERADAKTRAEVYAIRRQNGTLNADDWRAKENENALPGATGQDYWMPLNMSIAGRDDPIKANIVTSLVSVGFDPEETLAAYNMPPIKHLGLPPRSLQQGQLLDPNDPTSLYLAGGPNPPDRGADVAEPTATLVAADPAIEPGPTVPAVPAVAATKPR